MNAIEIKNLSKNFKDKQAVCGLNMTVPLGSIYGFIGENGSGKSTTEKIICGLLIPSGGTIKLFGKDYCDIDVRSKIGVLIESPGCYQNYSVWNNLMLQAENLSIPDAKKEVGRVLKMVRMEGSASNKFKNCSLGMKQRIGIAMALLGKPRLLVLDEPINGLDADGMRIMREILIDITKAKTCSVLISSHILGELEKIATHYGIIRHGKMIEEMTAEELDSHCRTYVSVKSSNLDELKIWLNKKYVDVKQSEDSIRIYDDINPEDVVVYLYQHEILVQEIKTEKIGLEEYYIDLMNRKVTK